MCCSALRPSRHGPRKLQDSGSVERKRDHIPGPPFDVRVSIATYELKTSRYANVPLRITAVNVKRAEKGREPVLFVLSVELSFPPHPNVNAS